MKSAKEKALEVCKQFNLPARMTSEGGTVYEIVLKTLQDHERDTRHACAKAVAQLPRGQTANTNEWDAINMDAAYAACINAKVK